MPFGNLKLYIFALCGTPYLLFSHIHTDDYSTESHVSCSKRVCGNYHINIRWKWHLERESLKYIYQITSAKWNWLREVFAVCLHTTGVCSFLHWMSTGDWSIVQSDWIYTRVTPMELLLIYMSEENHPQIWCILKWLLKRQSAQYA